LVLVKFFPWVLGLFTKLFLPLCF